MATGTYRDVLSFTRISFGNRMGNLKAKSKNYHESTKGQNLEKTFYVSCFPFFVLS